VPEGIGPLSSERLGKYHMRKLLKSEGMAAVCRGLELDTNFAIAITVLSPNLTADPDDLANLRRTVGRR
jgi:hypothetical protein